MHEIRCAECGEARRTRRSNTKYCVRCKVLRDLRFVRNRTYTCRTAGCSQRFVPLEMSDSHCPAHATGSGTFADCPFCSTTSELHRVDFPVCLTCLRDPAQRQRIIDSLQRGQHQRRQKNGVDAPTRRRLTP